ncbi:MAG: hypothetical protein ACD_76C00099G0009 [uncultured bacterium]|nr:MAG: hypothetical protein ACD_76C00099G0009 [uncultured bacterium]HBD05691.1 tRNA 2-thiouridine(34) synthase MnmA [Candidatus Uhrbacteria bacterium]
MFKKRKKILVAMSGGVDSSVSAALLVKKGYDVTGAFMKNWSDCAWEEDRRDALRVAAKLGIQLLTLDFEKEYKRLVVEEMIKECKAGRTPNPDILCNKYIKFDLFLKSADELGIEIIATGHYARIKRGKLLAGKDNNKDQTYFLWAMPRTALSRVMFPIGDMYKTDVRETAKKLGLSVADKKDSVGICFIGEVNMYDFLKKYIPDNPGDIVNSSGNIVGKHKGLPFYTIGQRHGLSIGGGEPYYVVSKDLQKNHLIVSSNYDQGLYKNELKAHSSNWLIKAPKKKFKCMARIRYRQPLEKCVVIPREGGFDAVFDRPQRAVTPGQSIVLYKGNVCLGGGIII